MNRYVIFGAMLVVVFAAAFAFYPCLQNGFTNWDDNVYLTSSSMARSLSWSNVSKFFSAHYVDQYHDYHPLTILTYALEYRFFQLDPFVYHLTNLVIHLANCALVFVFIYLLCGSTAVSFITALLFGIHPLHVESAAWVAERKDVLCSFFYCAALIFYVSYVKKNSAAYYAFSVAAALLAFLSKSMAITLPVVMFACDYYMRRRLKWDLLIEKIPFIVLAAVFTAVTTLIHHPSGEITLKTEHTFSLLRSLFVASHGILFYLGKIAVPVKLSCLYPYPETFDVKMPFAYIVSLPVVILMAAALVFFWKKSRAFNFGMLLFIIPILPVLQIIPATWTIAADRYMYLPSIGLFFIGGRAFEKIFTKSFANAAVVRTAAAIIIIGYAVILIFLTRERCRVWGNAVTLWNDVIAKYPEIPNAYNSRGCAYSDIKEYDEAVSDFTKAIEIVGYYAEAYHNRGNAYYSKGDFDRAAEDYKKAIELKPDYASAINNLGNAYFKKGEIDRAIEEYSKSLEADPAYVNAFNNRAYSYRLKGELEKSIADYDRAIQIDQNSAEIYFNRGCTYYLMNALDKAIIDYSNALALNPFHADALNNRGYAFFLRKEYDRAVLDHTRALELDPRLAAAYNNRGIAYQAKGDLGPAVADYTSAVSLQPDYANAYNNRGIAYLTMKKYGKAREDFMKARRLGLQVNPLFLEEIEKAEQK